jgi:hypothetical protein
LSRRITIACRGICTVIIPERDEQRNAGRDDHNERYRLDLHGVPLPRSTGIVATDTV